MDCGVRVLANAGPGEKKKKRHDPPVRDEEEEKNEGGDVLCREDACWSKSRRMLSISKTTAERERKETRKKNERIPLFSVFACVYLPSSANPGTDKTERKTNWTPRKRD